MRPEPLTQREAEVKAFLKRYQERQGYPASIADICQEFGWASKYWAHTLVERLRVKGHLEKDAHVARGLRLVGA